MSLLLSKTKWLWFLLALYSGPTWSPVACVSVNIHPKTPSTVESQAKFFQDFFSVQLSPYNIEFGHVCEDPNTWEQRYEKKDYKNHRDMGKVRWGDKKGGYGEHYWDLNHAGNSGNHGDDDYSGHNNHDDGSYHSDDNDAPSSSYDSPSDHSYTSDDYDPEKSSYEENGRAKRAHSRQKQEKRHKVHQEEELSRPKNRKHKEQPQEPIPHKVENYYDESDEEEEEIIKKPKRTQYRYKIEDDDEETPEPKDTKKQVVLVVKEKEEEPAPYVPPKQVEYTPSKQVDYTPPKHVDYTPPKQVDYTPPKQVDYTKYVPYEGGAGVRQHYQPEPTAAASVPRLFLEPTTGHVVDRATGQAYVLQPVSTYKHN